MRQVRVWHQNCACWKSGDKAPVAYMGSGGGGRFRCAECGAPWASDIETYLSEDEQKTKLKNRVQKLRRVLAGAPQAILDAWFNTDDTEGEYDDKYDKWIEEVLT